MIEEVPFIIFSKTDDDDGGLEQKPVRRTIHLSQTLSGDVTSLSMFIEWLKAFKSKQYDQQRPNVFLANANIYFKLSVLANANWDAYAELLETLRAANIYMIFYPNEMVAECNEQVQEEWASCWCDVLTSRADLGNLNGRLAFVNCLFEAFRRVYQAIEHRELVTSMFQDILGAAKLNVKISCSSDLCLVLLFLLFINRLYEY